MAYATLSDLRDVLGLAEGTDGVLLTRYLVRAQRAIDAYCRRTFEASADSTQYLDALADVDGRTLHLGDDFCALTSVTNGNGVVVASNQYVTEPRNGTPYRALTLKASSTVAWTYTTTPENAITVVGRRAYSTTAPADIEEACLMLASFYYNRRGTEGYKSVEISNAAVTEFDPLGMPAQVAALLAPYRRLV